MKFSEFEKVKVRADLKTGKCYGGIPVCNEMVNKYAGKIVTITSRFFAKENFYFINGSLYCWTDEMFEEESIDEKFNKEIKF